MKQRFFISIILLSFVIIVVFAQQSCGDYPCVLVTPEPYRCIQVQNIYVCACTAGAMVMKYWAIHGVVKDNQCNDYQLAFKNEFGTNDGRVEDKNKVSPALLK